MVFNGGQGRRCHTGGENIVKSTYGKILRNTAPLVLKLRQNAKGRHIIDTHKCRCGMLSRQIFGCKLAAHCVLIGHAVQMPGVLFLPLGDDHFQRVGNAMGLHLPAHPLQALGPGHGEPVQRR